MFLGHNKTYLGSNFQEQWACNWLDALWRENYVGPATEERLPYNPVPTGVRPGPALYAVLCISNLRPAFDFFITKKLF